MAALPLEIITEILFKLPPKPLLRFKCVSKSWNSLISSSNFIKRHLSQTLISDKNPKIVVSHHSLVVASISAVLRFSAVDHPLRRLPHRPAVELIESCDGVLFISDYKKQLLFLLNPSTKTRRLIPRLPSKATPKPIDNGSVVEVLGFGYDGFSDDYKVVRLLQWCISLNLGFCCEAAVYSVRKNLWVSIDGGKLSSLSARYYIQRTNAVFAKEMLHFVAVDKNFKPVLICFDLRTDTISVVEYPEMEIDDARKMTTSFRELNGCLCMLLSHQRHRVDPRKAVGDPLYNRRFLYADVWEMRERGRKESWVKLFKIKKSEIGEDCMYLRLVTYSKDKGSVLVEVDGSWFGWYDLTGKKMKRVSVEGLRVEESPHMAFMMVESLVSVANDKLVSKGETLTKKAVKKNDFLSSGFKLRL